MLVAAWCALRGHAAVQARRHVAAGIAAGVLFALEFLLIYRGLVWTTATRAVLFIYLAPFFVVIGSRWLIPGDHFHPSQWLGLLLSFVGIVIAFGLPTPASRSAADARRSDDGRRLPLRGRATTLVIKASALNRVSAEKTMLYQLVVSAPLLAVAALVFGEHIDAMPSRAGAWRLGLSDHLGGERHLVVWFALIVRYSASRLSAFTFLTPLFGVAAGHLVLDEPLTRAFAAGGRIRGAGLVLVNRPR